MRRSSIRCRMSDPRAEGARLTGSGGHDRRRPGPDGITALGQHLVGHVARGDDAEEPVVLRPRRGTRYAGLAHRRSRPRGSVLSGGTVTGWRAIRSPTLRVVRSGPRASRRPAAVEEPFEGRDVGDQAAELVGGQHQEHAVLGRARRGDGAPVAHQAAFAEAVARAEQRHEPARRLQHLDRAALDQDRARTAARPRDRPRRCGGNSLRLKELATRASLVPRQAVVGVHRLEEREDFVRVSSNLCLPVSGRRCALRAGHTFLVAPDGMPRRAWLQCAWAVPAPRGTRIDSTRSCTSRGGAAVTRRHDIGHGEVQERADRTEGQRRDAEPVVGRDVLVARWCPG